MTLYFWTKMICVKEVSSLNLIQLHVVTHILGKNLLMLGWLPKPRNLLGLNKTWFQGIFYKVEQSLSHMGLQTTLNVKVPR